MLKKIVLTGGPSSGKTTTIKRVVEYFENLGYKVIVISETATELILGGLRPFGDNALNIADFQELVLRLQLAKEEVYNLGANYLNDENILIIHDRGLIDNRSYVTASEFQEVCQRVANQISYEEMQNRYDAVIYLETSAKFYQTENNAARSEDVNSAVAQSKKTLSAWMTHHNLEIILPETDFSQKVDKVIEFISQQISSPHYHKQGKYLIDLHDPCLDDLQKGKILKIEQTYLASPPNIEKRLRKVITEGRTSYYFSVFKIGNEGKLLISEKVISKSLYEELIAFQDPQTKTIKKKRYISIRDGQKYTLDIFADNENTALLEIAGQLNNLPSYVIENVTNNANYQNHNLASTTSQQLLLTQ